MPAQTSISTQNIAITLSDKNAGCCWEIGVWSTLLPKHASREIWVSSQRNERVIINRDLKSGHFYFGKNRTFLNWLDSAQKNPVVNK